VSTTEKEIPNFPSDDLWEADRWTNPYPPDPDPTELPGISPKVEKIREGWLSTEQLEALPPPQPLVGGMLNLDSLAEVYGPPGTGKSFLTLDLAMHVARGAWWQGREVVGGPVVYVVAEGAHGFVTRTAAWRKHNRMTREVHPIHWLPFAVNIADAEWTEALAAEVARLRPALVVLDTLARSIVGVDENSAKDMGIVVHHLDKLRAASGACVLIVHHTGKDTGRGARGTSALQGALDTELELTGDADHLTLKTTKQKDMAEALPIQLALQSVDGTGSCAIGSPRPPDPTALSDGLASTLHALVDVDLPGGVSAKVWGTAAEKAERTFYRHRTDLLNQGLVVNVGTEKAPRYRAKNLAEVDA
jgi:hypothetical protein